MQAKRKTKIIATLGYNPSWGLLECMKLAGMDICRINFSHANKENVTEILKKINIIDEKYNESTSLLADLQGPKIRLGEIKNGGFFIEEDSLIKFTNKDIIGDNQIVPIRYESFAIDVKTNDRVLIDDGKVLLKVIKIEGDEVTLKAHNQGYIASRKGVSLPDSNISLPSMTAKDISDLDYILENDFQWIALSFVRSAEDIETLRHYIDNHCISNKPMIMAKIEKPQAMDDIENIIAKADGVMIARGDLGVEIPFEQVPMVQKRIIRMCRLAGKTVVVATQMMESMINEPRPTRAEVNDVANSVCDGANALMLSGETSIGMYPVETIQTMRRIIEYTEKEYVCIECLT